MKNFEVNFGVGPAGTGKTYLAVAKAVEMLIQEEVQKNYFDTTCCRGWRKTWISSWRSVTKS